MSIFNEDNFLILGARGMLGRELTEVFADMNPVLLDKEDLDITDEKAVNKKISALRPRVIINAAAYTAVDDCEKNKELAKQVNGEAVKHLFKASNKIGAFFVHYSTDYVFDGKNPNGRWEDDEPRNPINVYGKSKLSGEKYIINAASVNPNFRYYIIRTSWLYGKNGKNFVDTISELIKKRDQVKVVNDQYGKPTYANDLAKVTRDLLAKNYESGIYHATNETENEEMGITWYDFAQKISVSNREIMGKNTEIVPCSSDEFPRSARRPRYSALINTKLPKLRRWEEALCEYLT